MVAKMARRSVPGDLFGLEIECEGKKVGYGGDNIDILTSWAPLNDGSLRAYKGHAPCEWVFNGPVKYKPAVARVNELFDYFENRKTQLVCSNRTSVHVHYNMGDKNAYQLVNMFILFTMLEDLMDRYCGEERNGNLFCLSSRHAEQQIVWMQDACFKNYNFNMRADNRYCSFNFASIAKFGTVEFRGMRGLDKREDVLAWLSILNEFCEFACYKMKNPIELVEQISVKTPVGFLKEVFSPQNYRLLTQGLEEFEINQSIYDGLRLVQMLCYKVGTEFDKVRLRGRDFWAAFKEDGEAQPDVDPQEIIDNGGVARKAPRRNPFDQLLQAQRNRNLNPAQEQILREELLPEGWHQPPAPPVHEPINPAQNRAQINREIADAVQRLEMENIQARMNRARPGRDPLGFVDDQF